MPKQWEDHEAAAGDAELSGRGVEPTAQASVPPAPSLLDLLAPFQPAMTAFFSLADVRDSPDGAPGVATLSASQVLRPSMELLCVAVLLDSTVLHSIFHESWVWRLQSRSVSRVGKLQFNVDVRGVLGPHAQLDTALTELFLTEPCAAGDDVLDAVRDELLRRVADGGTTEELRRLRVPVVLKASCFQEAPRYEPHRDSTEVFFYERLPSPDQVVQLFEHLVQMGQHVVRMGTCSAAFPWVQFTLNKLRLSLDARLPLTPDVVRAARGLSQHSFITVESAHLDARTILCSGDELAIYLRALGRHSPDLSIGTGIFPYRSDVSPIDENGEDKRELIVKIMTALASCSKLRTVDVSGLLFLLAQPHNRLHFWRALLEILLAPTPAKADGMSAPHTEFCLKMNLSLTERDAALIEQIPGLATRRRRRINHLNLYFGAVEGGQETSILINGGRALLAVLSLVRDLESLVIGDKHIPGAVARAILQQSPQLRRIRLDNTDISSLEVFADPTLSASGKCLEQISLNSPLEIPQSGITAFLSQLLDTSTPLATSLRKLVIGSLLYGGHGLDRANAELLERVLCVNRHLQHVDFRVGVDTPHTTVGALLAHNGDRVWDFSKLPAYAVSQRCAFLSVVRAFALGTRSQVDAAIFRSVCEFAAPMVGKRKVFIWRNDAWDDDSL